VSLTDGTSAARPADGAEAERRSLIPSAWTVFWASLLGFFIDKLVPSSIELRFFLDFSIFCIGLGIATGSSLYLFRPDSQRAQRWFRPFRLRITNAGRCLAALGLCLGCVLMGVALLPIIQLTAR
jgi:hypothetical protein